MALSRIFFGLLIAYKLLINFLALPLFFLSNRRLLAGVIRQMVDDLINLEMKYRKCYKTLNLQDLFLAGGRKLPTTSILFSGRHGNINLTECLAISYLVTLRQPRRIFEIGTFDGFSTYHLAKNSPEDAKVYTLNLPEDNHNPAQAKPFCGLDSHGDRVTHHEMTERGLGSVYKNSDVAHKVVQLFGDSTRYDYRPFLSTMDLVFIDGGHSYDVVRSDTQNAFRLLANDGIILWHDFNVQHHDIYRFILELSRDHQIYRIEGTRFAFHVKGGLNMIQGHARLVHGNGHIAA